MHTKRTQLIDSSVVEFNQRGSSLVFEIDEPPFSSNNMKTIVRLDKYSNATLSFALFGTYHEYVVVMESCGFLAKARWEESGRLGPYTELNTAGQWSWKRSCEHLVALEFTCDMLKVLAGIMGHYPSNMIEFAYLHLREMERVSKRVEAADKANFCKAEKDEIPLQGVFDTRSYKGKVHEEACKLIVHCQLIDSSVPFPMTEFEY